MGVGDGLMARIASQLGHPQGVVGRLVGAALNRGNRGFVQSAVRALEVRRGGVVADVGFGGGVGLPLLLDAVGESGRVHGVEVSQTMVDAAGRRYRHQVASGQLVLHRLSMDLLPFDDNTLDGVMTVNTIYFLDELQSAFAELARVTAPRGRIVVGVADPEAMKKMPFTGHGFHLRPIPEVVGALRSVGLRVEQRRISDSSGAPHLLIASAIPPGV